MRVLVIRSGALGDLVYATSVIDALRYEYGEDTIIDFVTTPGSGKLLEKDPRVHTVFPLKHKKIPLFLSKEKKAIVNTSKQEPYDILINFEFGKQFKDLVNGIVAKKKVGALLETLHFEKSKINRGKQLKKFFKSVVREENLNAAYPKVFGDGYTLEENEYIVISPTNSHIKRSGINYRAWEKEKWKELIKKLSEKGKTVVLIGSPGEEFYFEALKPYPQNVINLVGKLTIPNLVSVVKQAQATICTDSAVGHISAAVNTPVFVLMGPNDTVVDAPYQTPFNKVIPISVHKECSPCYKTEVMKNCKDNICMKEISVEMVLNSLSEHLSLE